MKYLVLSVLAILALAGCGFPPDYNNHPLVGTWSVSTRGSLMKFDARGEYRETYYSDGCVEVGTWLPMGTSMDRGRVTLTVEESECRRWLEGVSINYSYNILNKVNLTISE